MERLSAETYVSISSVKVAKRVSALEIYILCWIQISHFNPYPANVENMVSS